MLTQMRLVTLILKLMCFADSDSEALVDAGSDALVLAVLGALVGTDSQADVDADSRSACC